MLFLKRFVIGAFLSLLYVNSAYAQMQPMEPVMVIRFNQPAVYYERVLYQTVKKAVNIKPNVKFNLMSLRSANTGRDGQALANDHRNQVASTLLEMGVPKTQIHFSDQESELIHHDEVHIFLH